MRKKARTRKSRFALNLCAGLTALIFSGCASIRQPTNYLSNLGLNTRPTIEGFDVCDGAGCRSISSLDYSKEEWMQIRAIFEPRPENSAAERERINVAIGAMETIIGLKNGTLGDAPRNRRQLGTGKQIDCIAEAANTTVALMLLKQEGLLHFHRVGYPQHRGFARLRLPHNSASVVEESTGATYVIDSWFFEGGAPAVSIPANEWKSGFSPN